MFASCWSNDHDVVRRGLKALLQDARRLGDLRRSDERSRRRHGLRKSNNRTFAIVDLMCLT